MASPNIELQNFLQRYIDYYVKSIALKNESVYAIYLEYLVDNEHDELYFRLYISHSEDKDDWTEEGLETHLFSINVNDEDQGLVESFYARMDRLSNLLNDALNNLDYSKLSLANKCFKQAVYSDRY